MIFSVFQKNRVFGYSWSTLYGIGATIRIGREMLCLPYAGFLIEAIPKQYASYIYIYSTHVIIRLIVFIAFVNMWHSNTIEMNIFAQPGLRFNIFAQEDVKKCQKFVYESQIFTKNPASGRHWISWPMRIVSSLPWREENLMGGFSKHWPSGPMLSISRNVRLSVCVFVHFWGTV